MFKFATILLICICIIPLSLAVTSNSSLWTGNTPEFVFLDNGTVLSSNSNTGVRTIDNLTNDFNITFQATGFIGTIGVFPNSDLGTWNKDQFDFANMENMNSSYFVRAADFIPNDIFYASVTPVSNMGAPSINEYITIERTSGVLKLYLNDTLNYTWAQTNSDNMFITLFSPATDFEFTNIEWFDRLGEAPAFTEPTVNILFPEENGIYATTSIDINFTANLDPTANISNVDIYINGVLNTSVLSNATIPIGDGNYSVLVNVTDTNGLSGSDSINLFTIDNINPFSDLAVQIPAATQYGRNQNITITASNTNLENHTVAIVDSFGTTVFSQKNSSINEPNSQIVLPINTIYGLGTYTVYSNQTDGVNSDSDSTTFELTIPSISTAVFCDGSGTGTLCSSYRAAFDTLNEVIIGCFRSDNLIPIISLNITNTTAADNQIVTASTSTFMENGSYSILLGVQAFDLGYDQSYRFDIACKNNLGADDYSFTLNTESEPTPPVTFGLNEFTNSAFINSVLIFFLIVIVIVSFGKQIKNRRGGA